MPKGRRRKKRAYHPKSASEHWNTTQRDLVPVRRLYRGVIDLDPCSNAGSIVGALTAWTKADNGLARAWFGNVFINPPFGRQLIEWFMHGVSEHLDGRSRQQVWLVPARCDTLWYHAFALQADAICTVRGRSKFRGAKDQAPFPILFIYYGPDPHGFRRRFEHRGDVRIIDRRTRLKAQRLARMFGVMSQSPPKDIAHLLGLLTIAWDLAKDMTLEELFALMQEARDSSEVLEARAAMLSDSDPAPEESELAEPADAPAPMGQSAKKSAKKPAKKKPAKKAPKKAPGSAATSRQPHVEVLDKAVAQSVRSGDGVLFSQVRGDVPDGYNNQQIRRSLVRLTKQGVITAEGNTRNRIYRAVEAA